MARPKGTKYIETPEELYRIFIEYATEVKANPRKRHVFVGKDGNSEYEKLERPLTMEGFRVWCFQNYSCVRQYFDNPDKRYDDYITVCRTIKEIIRQDQIEGGMVGQYNPSITQRLNNLIEKVETTNIEQPLFTDVPKNNSDK